MVAAMRTAGLAPLHDGLKRNAFVRHAARDRRGSARLVERGEANVVAAFMPLHRRAREFSELAGGTPKRVHFSAGGEIDDVGDDSR
jgi:hypothetical protein